ncbi:MAG: hypothetical protein HKN85_08120, partial [Gammaproteobacteria bacterium]|nr:hypothetical protein [Gammaproteobacteria bacterium]
MTQPQTPRSVYAAALMLALGNIIWVLLDNQPQPIVDPYVEKIFNLVAGLRENNWIEYPRTVYWASIGPRPPLYQLLAAPWVLIFGRSVDSILVVNSLFVALLSICTYLITQRFTAKRYAILAMVMVVSLPIQAHLNSLARPHAIVAAISALLILQSLRT